MLQLLLNLLFEPVGVVPRKEFREHLVAASVAISSVNPDDVPFLALALASDADVRSDDTQFQKQSAVAVWRTHELVSGIE